MISIMDYVTGQWRASQGFWQQVHNIIVPFFQMKIVLRYATVCKFRQVHVLLDSVRLHADRLVKVFKVSSDFNTFVCPKTASKDI